MYTNDSSSAFVTRGNRRGKGFFPPRTDVCDESSATPAVMIGGLLHTCTSSAHSLEILLFPFLFICYFFHWSLSKSVNNFVKKKQKQKTALSCFPWFETHWLSIFNHGLLRFSSGPSRRLCPQGIFFHTKAKNKINSLWHFC